MPRIKPVDLQQTDAKTAATLKGVQAKLGVIPNLMSTMAHSPSLLNGYLQFSEALSQGRLNRSQRELIAIAIAQENQCEYCLSAHAMLGKQAGLQDGDITLARNGEARDVTDAAIVGLAVKLAKSGAVLDDHDFTAASHAGLDAGLILEIVAQVVLNTLTNYVNHVAGTEVDFPVTRLHSDA